MAIEVHHECPDGRLDELWTASQGTWFGAERERADLERMLAGTDAVVTLLRDGEFLAFGHALTDGTYVAVLRDLVVAEHARGEGVGQRLVAELCEHPALADVDRISVTCPERLAGFYERCGFAEREDGTILVRESTANESRKDL